MKTPTLDSMSSVEYFIWAGTIVFGVLNGYFALYGPFPVASGFVAGLCASGAFYQIICKRYSNLFRYYTSLEKDNGKRLPL